MEQIIRSIAGGLGSVLLVGLALSATPGEAREIVAFRGDSPGTVVVKTGERRLYLVLSEGQAIRYPVGVGRAGKQWSGTSSIDGKYIRPAWAPPAEIRRDKPSLPSVSPG